MRIGIVCEGHSDRAVIENILIGVTGLNSSDFVPILPTPDNTSKGQLNPDTFGSWTNVVNECKTKKKIAPFLMLADSTHIVVHLDTAEADAMGIELPDIKDIEYCHKVRKIFIENIDLWLGENYKEVTLYAIAIQEIDAWVLTIFDKSENCKVINAKKRFQYVLGKKTKKWVPNFVNYQVYSELFRNAKKTKKEGYLSYNCSLRLFWEEAESKLVINI